MKNHTGDERPTPLQIKMTASQMLYGMRIMRLYRMLTRLCLADVSLCAVSADPFCAASDADEV
jgi:hypothetical protein